MNAGTGEGNSSGAGSSAKKQNLNIAIGVLELAETHVPDSTLLSYAHAELIEGQPTIGKRSGRSSPGEESIRVMINFCTRAGNILGYVLFQSLVRKYQGHPRGGLMKWYISMTILHNNMTFSDCPM